MPATNQRRPRLTNDRLALAGLLVFTLVVRGGVLWAMRANLQQDPDAYREIAENLLRHGEFALGKDEPTGDQPLRPTAYRPPLYPVVLSNLPAADGQRISLVKVAALHVLLGVAMVWLTWLTATRMLSRVGPASAARAGPPEFGWDDGPALAMTTFSHPTAATLLAGVLVACDPILLNQQTLVMTETLAAFLAILSLWCLAQFDANRSWFNAGLAGGAIGLSSLCRPTFLPWLGLVAMVMVFLRGRSAEFRIQNSERNRFRDLGWRFGNLATLLMVGAAVLSPWGIRNYRVFGKPIITTTHGGYTFYLANNREFYSWLSSAKPGLPWKPDPFGFLASADRANAEMSKRLDPIRFPEYSPQTIELFLDRFTYEMGNDDVKDNPKMFLLASVYRLRQLWSPLPHKLTAEESLVRRTLRYLAAAWYCGVYMLAAVGIWRLRGKLLQPPWLWGMLLCLAFTAVHTLYWTNLRMRAPLMPFVALVAAAAVGAAPRRQV